MDSAPVDVVPQPPQHITDSDAFAAWQSAVAGQLTDLSFSDFTRYNQRVDHPLSTEFSLALMVPPSVFNQAWNTTPREVIAQSLRYIADQVDGTNLGEDDDRELPGDFPVWIRGTRVGDWVFTNLPEHDTSWLLAVTNAHTDDSQGQTR